jgi:hypothetical protein
MNYPGSIVPLISLLLLGACVAGDEVVWVQGRVVDERRAPYAECAARLLDQSGKILDERPIQTQTRTAPEDRGRWIQPKGDATFIVEFVVPPHVQPTVSLSCSGSDQSFERRVIENRSTPDNPIDLGSVVLRKSS